MPSNPDSYLRLGGPCSRTLILIFALPALALEPGQAAGWRQLDINPQTQPQLQFLGNPRWLFKPVLNGKPQPVETALVADRQTILGHLGESADNVLDGRGKNVDPPQGGMPTGGSIVAPL